MLASSELDLTGEGREVIEAYRLFAYDQGWRQRMRDAVRTGLTAEAAVERVQDETRLRVQRLGDPILRERAHDFDDLARRLLRHLTGEEGAQRRPAPQCRPGGAQHGPGRIAGLWPRQAGGPGAGRGRRHRPCRHRRALHGPAAWSRRWRASPTMRAPATRSRWMARCGEVHLRPASEIVKAFEDKRALRVQAQARFAAVRDLPAVTRDGVAIRLMMNAGLEFDMPQLAQSGADGIGLFRTELQFMIGETMPRLADQSAFYKKFSMRRATSRWCSAPSIWAATRSCLMRAGSGKKIPRWAGAPSASRSIVRRCCATRCARC